MKLHTEPARAAFEAKFYFGLPVDLTPEERERRARAARAAYFTRLTYNSVRSRRKAAAGRLTNGASA
jgi:hypothetical protein